MDAWKPEQLRAMESDTCVVLLNVARMEALSHWKPWLFLEAWWQ